MSIADNTNCVKIKQEISFSAEQEVMQNVFAATEQLIKIEPDEIKLENEPLQDDLTYYNQAEFKISQLLSTSNDQSSQIFPYIITAYNSNGVPIQTIKTEVPLDVELSDSSEKEISLKLSRAQNIQIPASYHRSIKNEEELQIEDQISIKIHSNQLSQSHQPNINRKHICVTCQKSFATARNLVRHKTFVHSDGTNFPCHLCTRTYKRPLSLQQHLIAHGIEAGTFTETYKCDICSQHFPSKKQIRNHVFHVHSDAPGYPCSVCSKTFKLKGSLKTHLKMHEVNREVKEKKYPCANCAGRFITPYSLWRHFDRRHTKKFCAHCDASFQKKQTLLRHIVAHFEGPKFKCPISDCPANLQSSRSLRHHIMIHTGQRDFLCNYCSKTFRKPDQLKSHLVAVHAKNLGLNPPRLTHKCKVCKKLFSSIQLLDKHSFTHAKSRDYVCTFENCTADFKSKGNLLNHQLIHNNPRKFKCNVCNLSFKRNYHLKRHLLTQAHKENNDI